MQLDDLIQTLALGELSTSTLFEQKLTNPNALYEITSRNRAKLIQHINDATMAICLKLPLYWYSTVLRLVEGKNTYELTPAHSIRNMPDGMEIPDDPLVLGSPEAFYYIYDTEEFPFTGNILTIGKISSLSGLYDNIDIGGNAYGSAIYAPRPNVIEIPEDLYENDEYVTLHYSGHLPRIPLNTPANSNYEHALPLALVDAVAAYVSNKILVRPQDANNASVAFAHMDRFNAICDQFWQSNICNLSGDTGMYTFTKRGWL